jgi:tRNA(Glu) U13 pseudouridine synthase TruD
LQQNDKRLAAGARRPLRVPVANTSIGSGVDEHGGYVRVQFELPAGSYATVLIDELLKSGRFE